MKPKQNYVKSNVSSSFLLFIQNILQSNKQFTTTWAIVLQGLFSCFFVCGLNMFWIWNKQTSWFFSFPYFKVSILGLSSQTYGPDDLVCELTMPPSKFIRILHIFVQRLSATKKGFIYRLSIFPQLFRCCQHYRKCWHLSRLGENLFFYVSQ